MKIRNFEQVWITSMMIIAVPHFLQTLNIRPWYSIFFVAIYFAQELHMIYVKKASQQKNINEKVLVITILYYVFAAAYSLSPNFPQGILFLASTGALASAFINMSGKDDEQTPQ